MNSKGRTLLLALSLLLLSTAMADTATAQKKPITIRDVFGNRDFFAPGIAGMQWLDDGTHYSTLSIDREAGTRRVMKVDAATGDESVLFDPATFNVPDNMDPFRFVAYTVQENNNFVVFTISQTRIWRHSTVGTYAVYDIDANQLIPIPSEEDDLRNVKVAPDGKSVGYVRSDDLYIMDLATGDERRLTHDAEPNVYNGRFGWVYEEEFSIIDGWRWSPDSRRIAFWKEDERHVKEFTLTNWMSLYQDFVHIRYPKPGEDNPIMRIAVMDLDSGERRWMDIGDDSDIYIPHIAWTRDPNTLCIYRLNRLQNQLELLFADVETGDTRAVYTDRSETGWINTRDRDGHYIHFMKNSDRFLITSERDGWNHLYLYDYSGDLVRQVTEGDWEIIDVQGITPDEETVFYISTEASPNQRRLYRIDTDGGDKECVTEDAGWHTINMSPTCAVFLDSWSSTTQPTKRAFFDDDGAQLRLVSEVNPSVYDEYHWGTKELFTVTTEDGKTIHCSMIKPADFDASKKYPVFFDVYGGPGTSAVSNSWPRTLQQWYASEGFIVIQADNRGSVGYGTAFKHEVYKQLGKWEVYDYVQVAKYLGTLPYVNSERIGIWGWSYGGYMAALATMLGDKTFHTAVAIAPATDWRLYDTIYTERFMQRPQDNPDGYDVGSCLVHADNMEGNLLLIHGGMDDNVHVQQTMQLIDKLAEAGKQFDMRIYPSGDHGVAGGMNSRLGLFEYYVEYMKEHLLAD